MKVGQCKQKRGNILKLMLNHHLLSIIGCYALDHLSDQQKKQGSYYFSIFKVLLLVFSTVRCVYVNPGVLASFFTILSAKIPLLVLLPCFSCYCVAHMILRLGNSWLRIVKWHLIPVGVMMMDWYFCDPVFTAAFYLKIICVNPATMPWCLQQTSNYLSWILITKIITVKMGRHYNHKTWYLIFLPTLP